MNFERLDAMAVPSEGAQRDQLADVITANIVKGLVEIVPPPTPEEIEAIVRAEFDAQVFPVANATNPNNLAATQRWSMFERVRVRSVRWLNNPAEATTPANLSVGFMTINGKRRPVADMPSL